MWVSQWASVISWLKFFSCRNETTFLFLCLSFLSVSDRFFEYIMTIYFAYLSRCVSVCHPVVSGLSPPPSIETINRVGESIKYESCFTSLPAAAMMHCSFQIPLAPRPLQWPREAGAVRSGRTNLSLTPGKPAKRQLLTQSD